MARKKRDEIQERDITGLKYFDQLAPLLERLHDDGCLRDKAGNRTLHYDHYCLLVLLYLFNPICSSLRAVQQASELPKVQKRLGCTRAALGSLSEAATVFDPDRLIEIIQELGGQLQPIAKDASLKDVTLTKTLTLVDATLIKALPRVMAASVLKAQTGSGLVKWRLHSQFEVDCYIPTRFDVTRNGGGDNDERSAFERTIQADKLYVLDRGYAKFSLFNRVHAAKSSYVCRVRDNSVYEVLEEKPLTDADHAANVVSDQIVSLGQSSKKSDRLDHKIRLVIVKIKPHVSAAKYAGGSSGVNFDGFLRIATNLLDVPAEIIALLYHYRWTIEIFFRTFKHLLGCRHLLSHNQNGIEIQTYCAVIACLLISLWTDRKPKKRTSEMICYSLMGWADETTLTAHITKLQQHDAAKHR
ncbi:MAG: IS4 family transposase [Planctomycetia bacterium]|nr:IS4 family transposase [Planctomycetia bacterium]